MSSRVLIQIVFLIAALMFLAATGAAAQTMTSGSESYQQYCASCHGSMAKGDGVVAPTLKKPPADLTKIAERNNGVFPRERVAQIIDGRNPLKGHGSSEMPVWGEAFTKTTEPMQVDQRIMSIVRYLESIQAAPPTR